MQNENQHTSSGIRVVTCAELCSMVSIIKTNGAKISLHSLCTEHSAYLHTHTHLHGPTSFVWKEEKLQVLAALQETPQNKTNSNLERLLCKSSSFLFIISSLLLRCIQGLLVLNLTFSAVKVSVEC